MNDELDPSLVRHFAAAQTELDAGPFIAQIEQRLLSSRRASQSLRWGAAAVLIALAAALSPYAVSASVALSRHLAVLLLSPWGWGASLPIGAWVVWRARVAARSY
jgi:hypothetical protein